jgi:hypothetical protein
MHAADSVFGNSQPGFLFPFPVFIWVSRFYLFRHPQLEQHEVAQGQNPIFSLPEGITTFTATASRQTPNDVHSFRLVSACVTRNREFRGDRGDLAARCENVSAGHGSVFV